MKQKNKHLVVIETTVHSPKLWWLYHYATFQGRGVCEFLLDDVALAKVMLMGVKAEIIE